MSISKPQVSQVPLGKILRPLSVLIKLDDMSEYYTIKVKRRHGGIETREKIFGYQIKTKKQYRVIPNAFIISRVQCWHQAYAIVPKDIPENTIASTNYDQFMISSDVDQQYFWWLSHSSLFLRAVRSSAKGVVIEKMVLNTSALLEKTVPIPPIFEQRRIASIIDSCIRRISQARRLQINSYDKMNNVFSRELDRIFDLMYSSKLPLDWSWFTIAELLNGEKGGIRTGPFGTLLNKSDFRPEGIRLIGIDCIDKDLFHPERCEYIAEAKAKELANYEIQNGDVIIARSGTVGRCCVVENFVGKGIISSNLMRLRFDNSKCDPRLICYLLNSSALFFRQITEKCRGTSRTFFNQDILSSLKVPLPDIQQQHQILKRLDLLKSKIANVISLQSIVDEKMAELSSSVISQLLNTSTRQ